MFPRSFPLGGYGTVRPSGRQPSLRSVGSDPLSIPGVRKGFVPSRAAEIKVELFHEGDRVMHPKFGKGTVRQVTGEGRDARITILFPVFGEKVFALAIAPIIRLEE